MIRRYKESDLDRVIEIWYNASTLAHPFLEDDFVQQVRKDMTNIYIPQGKDSTWVYEKDNQILAFISMMGNEIGGLFVHPDAHAQGIGTALVNHVSPMHESLEVEVFKNNIIGLPFYVKHGFTLVREFMHVGSKQIVQRLIKKEL